MTINKNLIQNFVADESGQDLIEYALVAALIGLASVATLKTVATAVQGVYTSITTALNAAVV
jgi:pilus assembly protein Flp/PilA